MQKTSIFGHLGQKGPFWTVFGQNGQNGENFQKKRLEHFYRAYKPYLTVKFQKKVMKGFREKCEKPPFLGILGQNRQFWTVFGQNGQNGNFFQKKRLEHFSRTYKP